MQSGGTTTSAVALAAVADVPPIAAFPPTLVDCEAALGLQIWEVQAVWTQPSFVTWVRSLASTFNAADTTGATVEDTVGAAVTVCDADGRAPSVGLT